MAIEKFRDEHFFLSNMYRFDNGIRTPDNEIVHTSEQLYLAPRMLKSSARQVIEQAEDGFSAKKLFNVLEASGSPVRKDWDKVKVAKMRDCVTVKFVANPDIAQRLLETGEEELIEGNDRRGDDFWGVVRGMGENMLGKILMDTRDFLRQPGAADSIDVDAVVQRIFDGS